MTAWNCTLTILQRISPNPCRLNSLPLPPGSSIRRRKPIGILQVFQPLRSKSFSAAMSPNFDKKSTLTTI